MEWQRQNLPRGASLPFWPLTSFQRECLSLTGPASCHFFPTLCPTLEIWIFFLKKNVQREKQTTNSQQKIQQSLFIWSCQIFKVSVVRISSYFQRFVFFHFTLYSLLICPQCNIYSLVFCPYDLLLSLPSCDFSNLMNSQKLTQMKVWDVLTRFWKSTLLQLLTTH